VLSDSERPHRFMMSLMSSLACLALALATTSLAAVIGSSVVERTKEIGIRMTLGASPGLVARLVVRQAIGLAGIGVALGIVIGVATTRFLAESLYGVKPLDAPTFVIGAVVMVIVAAGASLAPALRAARVDPLVALRQE
jgi:ABC-type antimicrobial peptide transport system permease subunit